MHPLLFTLLVCASDPGSPDATRLWWGDWNGDGRLDAVRAAPGAPARLFENQGAGVFADVSATTGWPPLEGLRRVVFADLDGDGQGDLLAVAGGRVVLLGGRGGALIDLTESAGLGGLAGAVDARALDVDGDGLLDLLIEGEQGDRVLRRLAGGAYVELELGGYVAPVQTVVAVAAGTGERDADPALAAPEAADGERPGRTGGSRPVAAFSAAGSASSNARATPGRSAAEEDPEGVLALAFCNTMVRDKTTGNCTYVNTIPTLGEVYPLSTEFNVDFAGNVGMGTVAQTHKLTVQNQSNNDVLRLVGTGTFGEGARLNFGDEDWVHIAEVTDDKLEIAAIGGTNFTGDVGIGTPSPSFALDVTKDQAVARLRSTTDTNGSVIDLRNEVAVPDFIGAVNFTNDLGQTKGQIAYTGADDLALRVNNVERARFFASGQVDLGGPLTINVSTPGNTAYFENQATGQYSSAVSAVSRGPDGNGVLGWNLAVTGTGEGVMGLTSSSSGYGVFSAGDFGGTGAKYFVQPHPVDAAKEIRFVCLEGNESGTYFRGRARTVGGEAVIDVPEDFRLVTEAEGLTVTATPIGVPAALWIASQDLDRIVVRSNVDVEFNYFANGVRRGFADLETTRASAAYVPRERGVPYGTQYPDDLRRILVENGTLNPDFTPNEATAARLGWKLQEARDVAAPAAR